MVPTSKRASLQVAILWASVLPLQASQSGPPMAAPTPPAAVAAPAVLPFGVGEDLSYSVEARWLLLRGRGDAALRVEAVDTVHGYPTFRLVFAMRGGIAFYNMNDVQRSWLDVDGLFSRRFEQKLNQTTYTRDRTYDFFPSRMRFEEVGKPSEGGALASPFPLDDVSYIYHVRTLPLEVGQQHTEYRYYKDDGNPVTVQVLRRERVKVAAGEFDAIVVRPIIRSSGLFGEGAEAEVWISDDDRRLVLKIRANMRIGTATMELRSYTPGERPGEDRVR